MTPQIGIPSANQLPISQTATALPDMGSTITGYFRPLILVRVVKTADNFEITESRTELRCTGCFQPFGPRELKMKPEGQRAWNWQMLHVTPEVRLRDDEEFRLNGTRYRVMSQKDWSAYGYCVYELVQDYDGN